MGFLEICVKTNKAKMLTQLEDLWNYAQSIDHEDEPDPEPTEFKEISKEVIEKTVAKIDAKLSGNEKASSKSKAKLRYIKNNFVANFAFSQLVYFQVLPNSDKL